MAEKKLYDFVKELKSQGKSIDEIYEEAKKVYGNVDYLVIVVLYSLC